MEDKIIITRFDCKFEVKSNNPNGMIYQLNYQDGEWRGTPGTDGKKVARLIIKFLEENK